MPESPKTLRTCPKGHEYYKSSDCPVCPVCEKAKVPKQDFMKMLAAPARRALGAKHITSLEKLATFTEADLLKIHGLGPGSIPKLRNALKAAGLAFKK